MPIKVNPHLKADEAAKLFEFFEAQSKLGIKVWHMGVTYNWGGSQFDFDYEIFQRKRKNGRDGYRYELISKQKLGKGNFGDVYAVESTLAITPETFSFKSQGSHGRTRVVKIQKHDLEHPVDTLKKEYELTELAGHLAIKQPTIDGETSYTTMKKIKGRELAAIIEDDVNGTKRLTLQERIDLTKALLRALKNQVTDKGIIHRDIKEQNIMVDMDQPITVNVLDFGLSALERKPDGKWPGTPIYFPNEVFWQKGVPSTKIDVFAIARVLTLLWHVDPLSYDPATIEECEKLSRKVNLSSLFRDLAGLSVRNAVLIGSTLEAMLLPEPAQRLSLDEAIAHFSRVDLDGPTRQFNKKIQDYSGELNQSGQTLLADMISNLGTKLIDKYHRDLRFNWDFNTSDQSDKLIFFREIKTFLITQKTMVAERLEIDKIIDLTLQDKYKSYKDNFKKIEEIGARFSESHWTAEKQAIFKDFRLYCGMHADDTTSKVKLVEDWMTLYKKNNKQRDPFDTLSQHRRGLSSFFNLGKTDSIILFESFIGKENSLADLRNKINTPNKDAVCGI